MESLGIEAAEAPSLLNSILEWQVVGMAHGSHLGPGSLIEVGVSESAVGGEVNVCGQGWQGAAFSMESVTPVRPPHILVGCLRP